MHGVIGSPITILQGDCRRLLATLPAESVHCVVTSPPYWGLRDCGCAGQIGLEPTPEAYVDEMVAVFREVHRVLRDDGTLWLNLGDSYAGVGRGGLRPVRGIKAKDLIGIPWMVANALRDPYYTGKVKNECDRVWLAAMVDAEGSICGTEYQSGDRTKTNIYICITNTSVPIIEKCERIFPQEIKHVYQKSGPSSRICYRWDVERIETKALFIREIYPYLVAKRKQAILGYTFLEMQRGLASKKKGYLVEQHEQRSWLMASLSKLNAGENVDMPDWVIEPQSLYEPGYYLRQDIVWAKPNPMPESVIDRCTKAHEYIFLLSKSKKYYFDHEAIKEPAVKGAAGSEFYTGKTGEHQLGRASKKPRIGEDRKDLRSDVESRHRSSIDGGQSLEENPSGRRSKRSVWAVSTSPFSEAHFATFPKKLIEPCILAGCPVGGMVLDPFGGAGTTGLVAKQLGRRATLIELNPAYCEMSRRRIDGVEEFISPVPSSLAAVSF